MPLRQSGADTPRVGVGGIDIHPGLVELHAVVMELAADRVDPAFERHAGELIAWLGHRRCTRPLRAILPPFV